MEAPLRFKGISRKTSAAAFLLSSLFLFPLSLPADDLPPSQVSAWKVGEKFTYDVKWGIIPGGEATLEVRDVAEILPSTGQTHPVKTFHFVATAHSNAFLDVFYKVRDQNESWLDMERWLTHRFEQHNQEGKFILDQFVEYDWRNKRYRNRENVKGRAPKFEEGELTLPVLDTLSCLYYVRARRFQAGDEFTMDVHSGRNWPLLLKVLKKETVKVAAGRFECFVVEPTLRERGLFIQKGKKLKVWLTADDRKIPVMMQAEIFIGHVSAELTAISGVQQRESDGKN